MDTLLWWDISVDLVEKAAKLDRSITFITAANHRRERAK